jgi:hypothetical protein
MRTDEGGEEVVRETSEEMAVNPVSSSPELEYEEENQVAIPIPPPSLAPVRGQRSTRARYWHPSAVVTTFYIKSVETVPKTTVIWWEGKLRKFHGFSLGVLDQEFPQILRHFATMGSGGAYH